MRFALLLLMLTVFFTACDKESVYHEYVDFENRYWLVNKVPQFTFTIADTTVAYNVYCNIRNSPQYPFSRIFIQGALMDTLGNPILKTLLSDYLFEPKTGEPLGRSGLGDLFDHKLIMFKNHRFNKSGPYRIEFEQYMRLDTLDGVLSVGLSVEPAVRD